MRSGACRNTLVRGSAPAVECGARTPLASSPHPTQPPTSTAHPHTGYGLRSTHVVLERCVSLTPALLIAVS